MAGLCGGCGIQIKLPLNQSPQLSLSKYDEDMRLGQDAKCLLFAWVRLGSKSSFKANFFVKFFTKAVLLT